MIKRLENFEYQHLYLYLTALLAFGLPLSKSIISICIVFLGMVWLYERAYKKDFIRIMGSPALQFLLLFVLYQGITLFWSSDLERGLKIFQAYSFWLIAGVIALRIKTSQINIIITAFLSGMFISELLSYGMFFEFWHINGKGSDYPSPFMFHINYSIFLAITAIILFYKLFSPDYKKSSKIVMFLFFISVTGNLFTNIGRTGQIAFLTALIIALFLHYRFTFKTIIISILLTSFFFIGAYTTINNFQKRVDQVKQEIILLQEGNLSSSIGGRIALWIVGIDVIKQNPIIGVGLGDYMHASRSQFNSNPYGFNTFENTLIGNTHMHNQFLNTTIQGGLIGALLMLLLLMSLFKLPITQIELQHLNILIMTIFILSFMTDVTWFKIFPNTLFLLFTGLFIAASRSRDKEQME